MSGIDEMDLVTHVSRGTPMGSLLRSYWFPALLSSELVEPDGDPKAIRLLGEELVAFRDTVGQVGIMELNCPHRRSSLALGRNEEGGIRCIYHGFKMDVKGNILETPCEPASSQLKNQVKQVAYPVVERADLIWVYMGPGEPPPFPEFGWVNAEPSHRSISKMMLNTNYVQSMEGIFDSYHLDILHSGWEILHWSPEQIAQVWNRPSRDSDGRIETEWTDYGFHYAAIRDTDPGSGAEDYDYARVTEYVFPWYCISPGESGMSGGFMFIPLDDHHSFLYQVRASDPSGAPVDHDEHLRISGMRVGVDLDSDFHPLGNASNGYLQDRELMRRGVAPADGVDVRPLRAAFSGISKGQQHQDMLMTETMGSISDRENEHLGVSDRAIISFRGRLLEAVRQYQEEEILPTRDPDLDFSHVRSASTLIPKGSDWHLATWQENLAPTSG